MTQRSVGLDVVRAACVAGVVATHFAPFFLPSSGVPGLVRNAFSLGSFGVSGFFLLSAYLLMGILLKEVDTGQTGVWRRYWIRRALRIWPLYYLAILVVVVAGLVTATKVAGLPWLLTFTYNWSSWAEPNTFLSHFWSMGAEEQLYILIPILCFVAFKWRWKILVVLAVVAPITRWIVSAHLPYPAVWNFTSSHLDIFSIGVLLASLDFDKNPRWVRIRTVITTSRWVVVAVLAVVVFLGCTAALRPSWVFGSGASAWTYLLADSVWIWLMLKLTRHPTTEVAPVTRIPVWLGRRSYGIYVYHWPAAVAGEWLATRIGIPLPVIGLALLAGVLAFSEVSFRLIESPFLRLKSRFSRESAPVG